MNIPALLAGLFAGMIGSMGLGGGAVLIIYLVVFTSVNQLAAQGINLIFFVPIGILSVAIYAFKKQIKWRSVIPIAVFGLVGAGAGLLLTDFLGGEITSKIFGVFLSVLGLYEIFSKKVAKKDKR